MSDLYALLRQSIIDRDIRDARQREAVYAQARQAIIKQLWAFQPPLAADEIDTRVGAYDVAVEKMEKDLEETFSKTPPTQRAKPADKALARVARASAAAPPPEPEVEDAPDEEEQVPPISGWGADDRDEPIEEIDDEDDDYERGVPRAARQTTTSVTYARVDDEDSYEDEEPYDDTPYEDVHQTYAPPGRADDRWQPRQASTTIWSPATLIEQAKDLINGRQVYLLGGAIAALVIILVGLGTYFLLSRGSGAEEGAVTVDIGVRREVSDAATASRIPTDTLPVLQTYSLFEGRDPTIFATTPDNPVRFVSDGGYVQVSSSSSAGGVKAVIGPGLASRLAGQPVRITLVVRAPSENGASSMRFAYQSGVAISHWQTANLTGDFQAVGMTWRVPTMRTSPDNDYLLIEPGIPGDGTSVDIESIRIDLLASEES